MYRTQKAVATQPPIMIRPPIGVMGPSIFLGPMPSVRQYILPENIRVPTAIIFPAVEKSFDAATGFPLMDWSEDDACSADRARRAVAWNSWSVGWADMRERGGKQNKILAGRCSSSTHGPPPPPTPAKTQPPTSASGYFAQWNGGVAARSRTYTILPSASWPRLPS